MSTQPLSAKACEIIEAAYQDRLDYPVCHITGRRKSKELPKACITWEERPSGNLFFRKMRFENAGDFMRGHLHHFDHTTIIFTGSIRVFAIRPDGRKVDRIDKSPALGKFADRNEAFVLIPADTNHEIIALEDFTELWCCFMHRGKHGEPVSRSIDEAKQYASRNPDSFDFKSEVSKVLASGNG